MDFKSDEPGSLEYDPRTDRYRVDHDWQTSDSISETVVRAVATVSDREATDIEPLFRIVDPDALDAMFEPVSSDVLRDKSGSVSFEMENREVTVLASGRIYIDASPNTSE